MKKDFHNDVDIENLDIANKILDDSEQLNDTNYSKPALQDIIKGNAPSSKCTWKKGYTYAIASAVAACLVLTIGFRFLTDNLFSKTDSIKISSVQNSKEASFASDYSEIYKKLMSAKTAEYFYNEALAELSVDTFKNDSVLKSTDKAASKGSSSGSSNGNSNATSDSLDFYDTNEQTENVHEGDIVKTDGKYIYTATYNRIIITEVNGTEMDVIKKIKIKFNDVNPNSSSQSQSSAFEDSCIRVSNSIYELYVHNGKLIVIGSRYNYADNYSAITYVYVYDVSNPKSAALINILSQDGDYVSSRMKDDFLYTVTTHSVNSPTIDYCVPEVNGKLMTPDCIYLPEQIENDKYTVITSLDVTASKDFITSKSILGGSSNVYASQDNIYVINTFYDKEKISDTRAGKKALKKAADDNIEIYDNEEFVLKGYHKKCVKQYIKDYNLDIKFEDIIAYKDTDVYRTTTRTEIVKFNYNNGDISFISDCKIDGHTEDNLNFDEKDDYLRCVTTENSDTNVSTIIKCYDKNGNYLFDVTKYSEHISSTDDTNNIFVLDKNLNAVSEIDNLAKGESIYSARYLGNYGYFVTYEQTDPLFSVDFSDMKNPKIIGELKMPGYSEYLHFYGEDKLFGFGLEEFTSKPNQLKLEMFNVEDGKAEKESKTLLENYSYSESLYDYKAIMIDPEKNLIGFTAEEEIDLYDDWDYRQYYLVYSYKNNSFEELYKIKINKNSYDVRGLYIGNYLYVVSPEYGIYSINMKTYNKDKKVKHVKF